MTIFTFSSRSCLFIIVYLFIILPAGHTLFYHESSDQREIHFSSLAPGGRSSAMAGTGFILHSDIESLYWNPAGLVGLDNGMVQISHALFLNNSTYSWFGYAQPIWKSRWTIGASLSLFTSNHTSVFEDEHYQNQVHADNIAGTISLAYDWQWLMLGWTIKTIRENLGFEQAQHVGLDMGFIIQPIPEIWSFAMTARNLGLELNHDKLAGFSPATIQIGMGYHSPNIDSLTMTGALIWMNQQQAHLQAAMAYSFFHNQDWTLTSRIGLRTDHSLPTNHLFALTGGLELKWSNMSWHYTLVALEESGWSHHLSLTLPLSFIRTSTDKQMSTYNLAKQHYYQQRYVDAHETFSKLTTSAPWYRQVPLWSAHLDNRAQSFSKEASRYQHAYDLYTKRRFNEANAILTQILTLNPKHGLSIELKNLVLFSSAKKKRQRPKLMVHYLSGLSAMQQKKFDQAIQHFQKVLNKTSEGRLPNYQRAKEQDLAYLYFQTASTYMDKKKLLTLTDSQAGSAKTAGKENKSKSVYELILAQTQARAEQLYQEGMLAYRRNNLKKAITIWEFVLKLSPNYTNAHKALQRAKNKLKI